MQTFKARHIELYLPHKTPSSGLGTVPLVTAPCHADNTGTSVYLSASLPELELFKSQDIVIWLTQHSLQTRHSLFSCLSWNAFTGLPGSWDLGR